MAAALVAAVVGPPYEKAEATEVPVVSAVVATAFLPNPSQARPSFLASDTVAIGRKAPNVVGLGPRPGPARPVVIEGRGLQEPPHIGAVVVVGPRIAPMALARRP